jgi:dTDP-4-dehydrorhamnose 3,5-epimerase
MRLLPNRLDGPLLIEPVVHGDERGFFLEMYQRHTLAGFGVDEEFVQYNHSRSGQGIVRGMHFQPGMAKLIRCVRGAIVDVLVDIRPGSRAFGEWEAFTLSDENHRQVYCPDGFAHGFCVVSELADVIYGCTAYYDRAIESGFRYSDPEVAIRWPTDHSVTVSTRDANAPLLSEIADQLADLFPRPGI